MDSVGVSFCLIVCEKLIDKHSEKTEDCFSTDFVPFGERKWRGGRFERENLKDIHVVVPRSGKCYLLWLILV
jgi:hypothetical protein